MRGTHTAGRYVLAIVALLAAAWVGLKFPDVDQSWLRLYPIVYHRSLLTHGIIIPFCLYMAYLRGGRAVQNDPLPRFALMGLAIGLSVHLAFDLFPRGWYGFAQIYVPLYGWTTPLLSIAWLWGSLAACLFGGFRLLRNVPELYLCLLVSLVSFVWGAQSAWGATPLWAFLTLGVTGIVAFKCANPHWQPAE